MRRLLSNGNIFSLYRKCLSLQRRENIQTIFILYKLSQWTLSWNNLDSAIKWKEHFSTSLKSLQVSKKDLHYKHLYQITQNIQYLHTPLKNLLPFRIIRYSSVLKLAAFPRGFTFIVSSFRSFLLCRYFCFGHVLRIRYRVIITRW